MNSTLLSPDAVAHQVHLLLKEMDVPVGSGIASMSVDEGESSPSGYDVALRSALSIVVAAMPHSDPGMIETLASAGPDDVAVVVSGNTTVRVYLIYNHVRDAHSLSIRVSKSAA